MEFYFKELIRFSKEKYGEVLEYIQIVLMYDLQWLFTQNTEYTVLNTDETNEFYNHIYDVLNVIEDNIILSSNLDMFYKFFVINFKYGYEVINVITCEDDLIFTFHNELYDKLSNYNLNIDAIKMNNKILNIKGFFKFYYDDKFSIKVYNNDEKINIYYLNQEDDYSLNTIVSRKVYFEINTNLNQKHNHISFYLEFFSKKYLLNLKFDKIKFENQNNIKLTNNQIIITN